MGYVHTAIKEVEATPLSGKDLAEALFRDVKTRDNVFPDHYHHLLIANVRTYRKKGILYHTLLSYKRRVNPKVDISQLPEDWFMLMRSGAKYMPATSTKQDVVLVWTRKGLHANRSYLRQELGKNYSAFIQHAERYYAEVAKSSERRRDFIKKELEEIDGFIARLA